MSVVTDLRDAAPPDAAPEPVSDAEAFRLDVRRWLSENLPPDWREACMTQEGFLAFQGAWFRKLVAAGYATPHWPAEWPGGGRSLAEQKALYEEIARADAPRLILHFVATYHSAATLLEWGSAEQKAKYLPEILAGEKWCQGFSEPGAGSDLANLSTRAERRGDVYVVNGQKIWSTLAQFADRCLLLARSSTEKAKQAGLTFLILDMKAKGVTVRPIHQITGDEEFAEIFLDDVEVPVADRLGAEGDGWTVAQATLSSERGLTLLELSNRLRGALWRLARLIEESGRSGDAGLLRDFGRLVAKVEACCALADRFLQGRMAGVEQVGDASLIKLTYARTLRDYVSFGLRIGGWGAQRRRPFMYGGAQETGNWMVDFMNSYNWSIAGGSDEVQRNIISERMLGMPREPKSWRLEG